MAGIKIDRTYHLLHRRLLYHHPSRAAPAFARHPPRLAGDRAWVPSGAMEWPCTSCTPPLRQPWLADPRLGAVVVATHSQKWQVGQLVDVMLPVEQ